MRFKLLWKKDKDTSPRSDSVNSKYAFQINEYMNRKVMLCNVKPLVMRRPSVYRILCAHLCLLMYLCVHFAMCPFSWSYLTGHSVVPLRLAFIQLRDIPNKIQY